MPAGRAGGSPGPRPLALVGTGLLVFALGVALALSALPEWRTVPIPPRGSFRARFQEVVGRTGFQPVRGPEVSLSSRDNRFLREIYANQGEQASSWLASTRTGLLVEFSQTVHQPGDPLDQIFTVGFSLDGRPFTAEWIEPGASPFGRTDLQRYESLADLLEGQLTAPGESLGPRREGRFAWGPQSWRIQDLAGSAPPQQVFVFLSPPIQVSTFRVPAAAGRAYFLVDSPQILTTLFLFVPLALAAAVVFLALLMRSRIDLVNGALLAALALASVSPTWMRALQQPLFMLIPGLLFGAASKALWIFFVWSAGESLLRATDPQFTTSLDTLRRGRLGPRSGRGLLTGFALGSGLAGARLALYALAVLLPGISPAGPSAPLPVFRADGSPVLDGVWIAAGVTLLTALAVRFLPGRWPLPAAALLGSFVLSPFRLFPFPVEWAVGALWIGALVWACRRLGLTVVLTAAVTAFLLPAAALSGLHLAWLPASFALTAALAAGLLVLGLVGISRSEQAESAAEPPPPFIRRLAEERRIRHEVDLLARMQEGLLPQEMPRVEGYQIAARSVLAGEAGGDLYDFLRDEAGGLWIAAGDVAGHGYSCAVAQAMVKAGLLSLVETGETPSSVLRRLDQVLRGVITDHSFTSLALIRLDPETGEARLANAGYPYPLVMEPGRVTEIDLPGLPLGQGPTQAYADRDFRLPRGGTLVLCSDGLSEALDRNGNAYGFDRAREVVRAMGHRPAVEIVDALLNDCRRHLGAEAAPDDVTVVVVKRG
jgi:sigma-B regulation protein RsbU (phosphoserine phosphatase)